MTKLEKIYNNKAQHIERFATVEFNRTQVIEIAKEYAEFCCEEQMLHLKPYVIS